MLAKVSLGFTLIFIGWTIVALIQNGVTVFNSALLIYLIAMLVVLWKLKDPQIKIIEKIVKVEGDPEENKEPEAVILEIIRLKGKAKRHDILPHLDISKSTLVRILDKLEAEGQVVQVGERKASYYTLKV